MENKSLKETAKEYVPKRTLNVTDLEKVNLSFPIEDKTGTDKNGKDFDYKVIVVNSQEYRVPGTVLEEIQKILMLKPDAEFVKVTSTGSGLNTSYAVTYLEN